MSGDEETVFLKPGVPLRFADREDLLEKLDRLDVAIPGRSQGRRIHHREHHCIVHYLRFLAGEADLLPLPVTLRKSAENQDPPDFVLQWENGHQESFEITEGSTQEYQQRLTAAARAGERGLDLPVDINTPEKVAAELWAGILFASFLKKAEALLRGRHAIDHLLIYDLTGMNLVLPLQAGAPLLRDKIRAWLRREQPVYGFTRISVLRDLALLFDLTGEGRLLRGRSPYSGALHARDEDDLRRRLRAIDRYCRGCATASSTPTSTSTSTSSGRRFRRAFPT